MANMTLEKDEIKALLLRRRKFKKQASLKPSTLNYHYKSRGAERNVITQVHLFTSNPLTRGKNVVMSIPVTNVMDVHVLKFDKEETTERRINGVLATVATVGIVIMVEGLYSFSNNYNRM
jgi:hypothetical protein